MILPAALLLALAQSPAPDAFQPAREALQAAVDSGFFPGGVLVVVQHGRVVFTDAAGRYGEDDGRPVTDTTVYDLASLTKVVGLTSAVILLLDEGRLDLDAPVRRWVPEFRGAHKDRVTLRHLLTHSSGLPAWRPLYELADTRAAALDTVFATPLDTLPGTRTVYSDLGAILLAEVVERVTGEPLDLFLARRVFGPLELRHTRFQPPPAWRPFIAPTERDPWRGRVLRGEVHDENAARLEGRSGHAGLFSDARDLAVFAAWLLDAWHGRVPAGRPAPDSGLVRVFTRPAGIVPRSTRGLGWDTPSRDGSGSGGRSLGPHAFGHTGFTGTSMWLDPDRDVAIILLTNRVHPTRENRAIFRVRPRVADAVLRALDGR